LQESGGRKSRGAGTDLHEHRRCEPIR
jgi:hypothetical protein